MDHFQSPKCLIKPATSTPLKPRHSSVEFMVVKQYNVSVRGRKIAMDSGLNLDIHGFNKPANIKLTFDWTTKWYNRNLSRDLLWIYFKAAFNDAGFKNIVIGTFVWKNVVLIIVFNFRKLEYLSLLLWGKICLSTFFVVDKIQQK